MSNTIKTIIFLVIAFVIVVIITLIANNSGSTSPVTQHSPSPSATTSPLLPTFTLADIARHSTKADCWTTIQGSVYNVTTFIPSHPGGDKILAVCGKDGTAAFQRQHTGDLKPQQVLATLKIGTLTK